MKIACFGIEPWEKEVLAQAFLRDILFFSSDKISKSKIAKVKQADVLVIFVDSRINTRILGGLPNLKFISTMSTGFDHIDISACRQRNIKISNVPTYGENTVAEHAMALLLALSRKLIQNAASVRAGTFHFGGLRGVDLKGKTLGIIGGGHIGLQVAKMARGFDMNTLVFDVLRHKNLARKLGFRYVSFSQLLKRSDFVTIHVPYNKNTHHLLDKKAFDQMKEGAYLINTSRGAVVDTGALLAALRSKKIAAAGLDVLEQETGKKRRDIRESGYRLMKENKSLLNMPNVIVTPHCGYNTQEALSRIMEMTIGNIKGYKKGKLRNRVV